MKYILTRQAEEDLIEIYLYGLRVFGSMQAESYYNSLEKTFERIAENHKIFPLAPISGKDIDTVSTPRIPSFSWLRKVSG